MPKPLDLVVKNALNSRAAFWAEIPIAPKLFTDSTATTTTICCELSIQTLTIAGAKTYAKPAADVMASSADAMKLPIRDDHHDHNQMGEGGRGEVDVKPKKTNVANASAMPPGKNCAAKFQKFLIWLRTIRRASQGSRTNKTRPFWRKLWSWWR